MATTTTTTTKLATFVQSRDTQRKSPFLFVYFAAATAAVVVVAHWPKLEELANESLVGMLIFLLKTFVFALPSQLYLSLFSLFIQLAPRASWPKA